MASTEFDMPLDNDLNALGTNLGSPSSASSVTGADAFSKINTLNGKIANMVKETASPSVAELKAAKIVIAYVKNADGTGTLQPSVCYPGTIYVMFSVWNGTTYMYTSGTITWDKTNGSLTANTDHSDRNTTLLITRVVMIF